MAQAELEKKTLTRLHDEVTGFDATIAKQKGIVAAGGQNIIKEFSPLDGTPPEEVINGIYNVLQRRLLLVTRIEAHSIPYLEERKAGVEAEENSAISQAREVYEKIQALLPLGICSPEELAFLERKISELPEDVARQIRILPVKKGWPQTTQAVAQEIKPGFIGRILRLGRRKNTTPEPETQIIGSLPQPIRSGVLHVPRRSEIIVPQANSRKDGKPEPQHSLTIEPFRGEIPDVAEIVGKKAILQQRILTAIFEATLANEKPTKIEYARKLFQKELKEGSMTEEKAVKMFMDSLNWVKGKVKQHGYEIFNAGGYRNYVYLIHVIKSNEEGNTQKTPDELIGTNDALPDPSETSEGQIAATENETNKEKKQEFPDGKFLGKENVLPRRIYETIIDFSSNGRLPSSEHLENIIFGEEIKAGKMTQEQAHLKIRDGLSLLRKKLKGTVLNLANKGTVKSPFYKLELTGQTEEALTPTTINATLKSADKLPNKYAPKTVISFISESTSLPSPEVAGIEGSIRRRYYEFLLSRHTDGKPSTIDEETIFLYGENSRKKQAIVYAMRGTINLKLKPYGIRIEAEKNTVEMNEKDPVAQSPETEIPVITQEAKPVNEEPERKAPEIVEEPNATHTDNTEKIRLRAGEKATLLILSQTSPENPLSDQEIAEKLSPYKKVRRDDITNIRTSIAGLKQFSLTGTGIEILNPLTEDRNPILNKHYLKLPEGKRLEDIIDFESGAPLPKPANTRQAERPEIPVASVDLQEGRTVELDALHVPEKQEIPLPHFVLREKEKAVDFSGRQYPFRFADQWEVFRRVAAKPNQELTPQELAGLPPESNNIKALELAENHFRGFMNRFEENPRQPQIFIITGGNRYPRFTFRATVEFEQDSQQDANNYSLQR